MKHGQHPVFGDGRMTDQRRCIADAAASLGAFTVAELRERAAADCPRVGLATVYRAVIALESAGSVQRVGVRDGSELYVWCLDKAHHHHLVCVGCGTVGHAPCPFGEAGAPHAIDGFRVTKHEVTLYGVCPRCAEQGRGD